MITLGCESVVKLGAPGQNRTDNLHLQWWALSDNQSRRSLAQRRLQSIAWATGAKMANRMGIEPIWPPWESGDLTRNRTVQINKTSSVRRRSWNGRIICWQ